MSDGGQSEGEVGAAEAAKEKSGAQRRKEARERAEAERLRVEALPEGDESQLEAMRHVLSSPVDRTYQHWSMRQWLKDNPDDFRKTVTMLERAERMGRGASPGQATGTGGTLPALAPGTESTASGPLDEGVERVKELLAPEWSMVQVLARAVGRVGWERVREALEGLG